MGPEYINTQMQQRLFNHELALDKEALWQNIATAQSKRKPRILFWIGAFVLLLGLISYMAYSQVLLASTIAEAPTAMAASDNDNNSQPEGNGMHHAMVLSMLEDEDSKTSKSTTTIEEKEHNESNLVSKNKPLAKAQTTLKSHANLKYTQAINPMKSDTEADLVSYDGDYVSDSSTNNKRNVTIKTEISPNTPSPVQIAQTRNNITYASIQGLSVNRLDYNNPRIMDINLDLDRNSQNCFTFGKERHPWSLYAYAGPSVLMKNLSTNTIENETYRSERESSENVLESIRAGLQLKYQWDNGWYVKAGLELNRLNERIQFSTSTDSTYTLTNQVIKIIIDSQGNEIPVYGDITVSETKTQQWTIYNKYKFVNLPLAVGYSKSKNRWSYGGELGLHINLSFNFEGQLLTPNGQPTADPDFLKNNAGLALSLTGGVGYQILPRVKLWLTPSIMKLVNPINIDSYPIDQSYTTTGLLLGLEFKF